MTTFIASAALAAIAAASPALTAHVARVAYASDKRTLFGSSAVIPRANASDPALLTASWVYDPLEIVAIDGGGGNAALWRLDTSKLGRQMWSVRGGAYAATAPGQLNAAAHWIDKDDGITGNCSLAVFDAARSPEAPGGNGWRTTLEERCALVNLAISPASYVDLSVDGSLVVAMAVDAQANVTVFAFDAQTGRARWSRSVAPTPAQREQWTFSGVHVSADAQLVTWSCGEVGAAGAIRQYVVSAKDGADAAPPLRVDAALEPPLSPDGEYTAASFASPCGGDRARVLRRNATGGGDYEPVGAAFIDGPAADGSCWSLMQAALTFDPASARTFAAFAWSSTSLNAAAVTMYDVDALEQGPVASYVSPVSTGGMDSSGAVLACFERLCVFGGYPGSGVAQPTVVLIDASAAGPVWSVATNGSVMDVSIAPAYVPETYFVSASGCTTPSICTGPGAEASLWTVSFTAAVVMESESESESEPAPAAAEAKAAGEAAAAAAVAAAAAAAAGALAPAANPATRVYLSDASLAAGALALDGSRGVYYVARGAETRKFVIFQKGGGWASFACQPSAASANLLSLSLSLCWPPRTEPLFRLPSRCPASLAQCSATRTRSVRSAR